MNRQVDYKPAITFDIKYTCSRLESIDLILFPQQLRAGPLVPIQLWGKVRGTNLSTVLLHLNSLSLPMLLANVFVMCIATVFRYIFLLPSPL